MGKYLFSYDPLGRRVKKVDENPEGSVLGTTTYHYDGSEVAVEYQPSTTWTYYLGLGIDQVVMRTDGTNKQWYYRDGHGSVSAVADNSGDLLEAYEYNAQGQFQITNASGTDITATGTAIGNELMYTGREYDAETGNYFYRARYYNPNLGRFISRDPLSGAEFSQGTNLYAYCRNNFLNSTDPTGTFVGEGILLGGALGGMVGFLGGLAGVIGDDIVSAAEGNALLSTQQVNATITESIAGGAVAGAVAGLFADPDPVSILGSAAIASMAGGFATGVTTAIVDPNNPSPNGMASGATPNVTSNGTPSSGQVFSFNKNAPYDPNVPQNFDNTPSMGPQNFDNTPSMGWQNFDNTPSMGPQKFTCDKGVIGYVSF